MCRTGGRDENDFAAGRCSLPPRCWRLPRRGERMAEELRILSWQGYADDDWVKEFEKETGADVNVVFIGTDDEIWAKIKGSEGKDFDLMAVNTAQLQRYIDAGLATPHDLDMLPNQKQTLPRFRDLTKVCGHDARRQGLRHPLRLRLDRHHLRHRQR